VHFVGKHMLSSTVNHFYESVFHSEFKTYDCLKIDEDKKKKAEEKEVEGNWGHVHT
jgi:hypothetical protein